MKGFPDLMERMDQKIDKMSKGHKKIASYIKKNYDSAVFMTAAELGTEIGVSESTVVRFATALGYRGFPEFTKDLEEMVRMKWDKGRKVGITHLNRSQSEILTSVLQSDMEKIADTVENLDAAIFESAVDTILEAEHVYVIGLRSCEPLASFLYFYLSMIRRDVIMLNTTSVTELFEQMIHISDRDAIIGISFPRYSMRTLKALEFANERNAKVITITDSDRSPMNLYSSCNLLARSDMVSIVDSLVAPLSVINALIVAICVKAPDQARDNLKELERVWSNYQVYLNDEINFIDDEPIVETQETETEE